ncbi:MAG: nucleotide sugar dehydrogenase [Chloroflexi bacterium]|nr:nucleotide sugar dehydrogenase [Chloroflexota bacterium]
MTLEAIAPAPSRATPRPAVLPCDVAVVGGGGHVGLPLSLKLAEAGMRVAILDIAEETVQRIRGGEVPFMETGAEDLLREILPTGRLVVSTDPAVLHGVPVVVVVIGTPIDEFLNPSMAIFDKAVDQLAPHLADGALVVLRSTVYPGTTAHVRRAFEARRLRVDVVFCPERIAEGKALVEIGELPQIVGADDDDTFGRAAALFHRLGAPTVRASTAEAEFAKLLTNTWRYMKFAIANQFFVIAHEAGLDYNRILGAIRTDYPRALDLPGPGFAAGPCLLKDTMQLAAFTSDHFPMGQSAMQINEGLPAYLVAAMRRRLGDLTGRRVGILGMAFKADSDDTRASLSYKLRKLLVWAGADVLCTDPYVRDPQLLPLDEVLERSEILVVGAAHASYRGLDLSGKDIVDIWGITERGIVV